MQRRRFLTLSLAGAAGLAGGPAGAQQIRLPPAEPLPIELVALIDDLPGRVTLGNPRGEARIVEFFDYNCPYCRASARDLRSLLTRERELSYVLVNYAVLGRASVEATRVALAFTRQSPERYLDFHEQLFGTRGRIGADQALPIALSLGADREELLQDADSDAITGAMVAAVRLGDSLGLNATPSYVAGRDAFKGYVDLAAKTRLASNLRRCEKAIC